MKTPVILWLYFWGGFLIVVTLFSDGFSDFIRKVKKKRKNNIAFPRKEKVFTKGRHSHYSSAQKAAYLTLVFYSN